MREITTDLNNILSLIPCARDYGFEHYILFGAFAELMNHSLSNEEIENYSRSILEEEGYEEEDYEAVKESLTEFKERYIDSKS